MIEAPESEAWTVARVLAWATKDFAARDFDSPRLDAELLLSRVLGLDRVRLILEHARPLDAEELSGFRQLIQRRRACEPIAYVLGEREFYGHRFVVDRRVLVPRPDTETLVETALRRTRVRSEFGRALDLCTGSGCVAISFAKERPTWRVKAADLSSDALCIAKQNAERLGVTWGMSWHQGDLFDGIVPTPFDLITANPPYIPSGDIADLQEDIKSFEPHLALDGGADGLDLVRPLLSEARRYLAPGGVVALEIGYDQAPRVAQLMQRLGYQDIEADKDLGGIERVVSGVWPSPAAD